MNRRAILEVVRTATANEVTPLAMFGAHYSTRRALICVHEAMYEIAKPKVEPLLVGCEVVREMTRAGRFVAIETRNWKHGMVIGEALSVIARVKRRQARVAQAAGKHLPAHYRVLYDIQRGRCYFTGVPLGPFEAKSFSVDHLVPLATRTAPFYCDIPGTNWPSNLALVTRSVNSAKGGMRPQEFVNHIRRTKHYPLRPLQERREIDRKRVEAFTAYMQANGYRPETEWE